MVPVLLSTGSLHSYGLHRIFELAAEAGYDGVEVMVDYRFDTRDPEYLLRLSREFGLPVRVLHAPFDPTRLADWPDSWAGSLKETGRLARKVGARTVVVHPPFRSDREGEAWLQGRLVPYQRQVKRPRFCLENMPAPFRHGIWRWLPWISPPERYTCTEEAAWSAFPFLTFDTTHAGTRGWDLLAVWERVGDRVGHIHLSNYRPDLPPKQREHRLPDDGILPLRTFLERLVRDGYAGTLTLELNPRTLEAHRTARVREHLRRALAFCKEVLG